MRIGTSRADRIGFIVFVVLASLLAVLLLSARGGETDTAQVGTFAALDGDASEAAAPAPVATTAPVVLPTATPTPEALPVADAPDTEASTLDDASEAEEAAELADDATETDDAEVEALETASGDAQGSDAEAAPAATTTTAQAAQPAATAVPNPQPAATQVPNPQPQATEVPNPQPQATAVPNPQPASQPVAAAVNVPADAPAGGTFTHTLTATVSRPTLHTSAGGPAFTPTFNGTALPAVNPTVFGNPLVYRVLAGQPGDAWAKVYVPARPNGTTAWVQTSQFNWGSSNQLLQINISNNTVTLFEGSNVLISTAAVTGKSSSPTPRANGWVEEIMAGPSSAYGPRLISLGIFSDALNSFGGSIPKIALHGTNNPGLMGQYASNGCIRVPNDVIQQIAARVKIGSKVVIVG